MKPTVKLIIVANSCPWASWPDKVAQLKAWFGTKLDLEVSLIHTQFKDIPFQIYGDQTMFGVSRIWYDDNISPFSIGHDIVLFVLNLKDWKNPNRARGWRTDNTTGAIELQLGADENEQLQWPNFPLMSSFFQEARHEIMHALFYISKQPDTTHYWWDRGLLEYSLREVILPKQFHLSILYQALDYLKAKLNKLLHA